MRVFLEIELDTKVSEHIGSFAGRAANRSSRSEEKNQLVVEPEPPAEVEDQLVFCEVAQGRSVNLSQQLQLVYLMPKGKPVEPLVGSEFSKLVAKLPVDIERANASRHLDRQQELRALFHQAVSG